VGELLDARRMQTDERLAALHRAVTGGEELTRGRACVYLTGSFARGEASEHSDLDLFIVGRDGDQGFSRLDAICLQAALIHATARMELPPFSGDGEHLQLHTVSKLLGTLGKPEDDSSNTFTARLLLLLESRPLFGKDVFDDVVAQVIDTYWRDFADHSDRFMPAFLANDILRLWRTFCVNYEARTASDPPEKKAKRKLKNYKLKHSRLLTCFSALAYLLVIHVRSATVTREDAKDMVSLSPTQRIEWISQQPGAERVASNTEAILRIYERFLQSTSESEPVLMERFMNPDEARRLVDEGNELGASMYQLLAKLGEDSDFHRLLVV
jgi:predicted nucleotidyltransferase